MTEEIILDENEKKINELLLEFDEHRLSIKSMIVDLEKIRSRVDKLIPETLDMRYVRLLEEKVKSLTNLFNSLLEMRKEIAKSVKDEIEIRRRIIVKDKEFDLDEFVDVRSMADKIDEFKEQNQKLKKQRLEVVKKRVLDADIEIPGITLKELEERLNESE